MKFYFGLAIFFLGFTTLASAQIVKTDSIKNMSKPDSLNSSFKHLSKTDSLRMVFKPMPRKAALYSALCPGLGQIYNRKYWKAPLVYAAMGTVAYFIAINYSGYNSVRNGITRLEDNNASNDNQPIIVRNFDLKKYDLNGETLTDLLTVKKYFRQNLDMSVLAGAIVYVLNIVDANVDAHLYGFDVNENLAIAPLANQNGMGVAFKWR
jgi:Family of unknown function (DUF5683)